MRIPVPSPRSLAGQLFAMQAVLIAVLVAGYAVFTYVNDERQAEDAAGRQATAVARSVADSPSVHEAIATARPSVELQPYAMKVMADTEVDFVTIMDPRGIRWTHPSPDQIGRPFLGHIDRALKGETITETYTGTLGASVRAVTPIENDDHVIIGLVSAGIKVEAISERVRAQLATMLGVAAGALALGGLGTYVINARLRRHTHGMNAAELSHMHDYHEAALHAVREGLLMLDGQYRVALINDGGRELLGVAGDVVGRSVAELGLPAQLTGALLASEPRVDEVHLAADRVLVVNTSPVSGGERRGTVVTLRDVTELQSVMGELDSERGFTQALRSQAHEAANRLHTVVSLIELGRAEEAVDFATAELELAQALTDQVVAAVGEPVLAALLLGKTAQANERGVELVVSEDSRLDDGLLPPSLPPRDLVTILGNLIDNAVDAAQGSVRARVTVTAYTAPADGSAGPAELVLRVSDTGTGVDPAHAEMVFQRGFSTKPSGPGGRGLGLALARQAVQRHGGVLTVTEADGGGAEFDVRMPLRTAMRAGGSDAASQERAPQEPAPRERASREPAPGEPTLRKAAAPEAATRKTASPETASPETASPQAAARETASPETAARKTASPETAAREAAAPEAAARETASPEAAARETASPQAAARETASPETAARKTASPETAARETASPETAARETASTQAAARETASTQAAARKTASPETRASESVARETPTPETVVPKAEVPETAGRKAPAQEITGQTTPRKHTDPETAASEATAWRPAATKTTDPHPAASQTGPEETAPQEAPVRGAADRGAADRAIVTPATAPREGTPSASPPVRASRGPGGTA